MIKLLSIRSSTNIKKKFDALFEINGNLKKVSFGAKKSTGEPYSDFTKHKDVARKLRYIARHEKNEDWSKSGIDTAGFWSYWLLWNKPSIKESYEDIKKRFL